MNNFERAYPPKDSQLPPGESFHLSNLVDTHCANSVGGCCVMRRRGDCLLDNGRRCEYFEAVIIPLIARRYPGDFKSIRVKYGGIEKVPAIPVRFPDVRICQTCKKTPLRKRERICRACWNRKRNTQDRRKRRDEKLGIRALNHFPTLTPQGVTSSEAGLPSLPTLTEKKYDVCVKNAQQPQEKTP